MHQLSDECLVDRRPLREVEAVQRFDRRKSGGLQAAFRGPAFAFEQFRCMTA